MMVEAVKSGEEEAGLDEVGAGDRLREGKGEVKKAHGVVFGIPIREGR